MRSRGIRRVGAAWLWLSTAGIVGFYLRLVWESWLGARLARRAGGPALALASPQPRVSVIVPARNEARNIRRCVASLLGQAYPDFEVIVVDDGSTDATPQILSELRHGAGGDRLRIIPAGELPAGWAGKPHAMAVGAAAATGAWLLFTDADTLHRPGALAWAAREAQRRGADLFSGVAQLEFPDVASHIILPVVVMGITTQYPPAQVANPKRTTAIANGQFLCLRRAMYDAVGGYAAPALRGSVVDDRDMAAAVKSHGGRVVLVDASDYVSVCMYRSFGEQWRGWSKNAYAGSRGGPLAFLLMVLGLPIGTIVPFVLALAGLLTRRPWLALAGGVQTGAILAYRAMLDRQMRHSRWWGLTHPLAGAVMTALMARVATRQMQGRGVEWSGRTYHIAQSMPGAEPSVTPGAAPTRKGRR
jgi:chlorobactene glucosyltransferase